ncbi:MULTISPECIES: hypothetical protein [unclassified Sphingosinithalassobacter]|uniref:hypothetical protein n=1 Tax=unclassified Sphingosinithalassobacter TaxID=2676235 RepID=UPI00165DFAEE|nr:hypothetical protein [Sphingosinithalassobacter sp. CS137]
MRALLSKLVAGSMIAGAALAVSACTEETTVAVNETSNEIVPIDEMGADENMVTTLDATDNLTDMNMMDDTMDMNTTMDNTMVANEM